MEYNNQWGGTVPFPKEKWQLFYDDFTTNNDRFYFHIYNLDNVFIGEVSTKFSSRFNSCILNIKIKHQFRGNNHGSDALDAFLDFVFIEIEVDRICDNVGLNSITGIRLLKSFGFLEQYKTSEFVLLELKRENYL